MAQINDTLSNNSGANIYSDPEQFEQSNNESATSDVLQEDDLHEVQVNDDLNEPDPETSQTFDENNTSTPDEVQGEGTELDSMDDGSTEPTTNNDDDSE